jgi:flavin reductase (DIM6/NTAB) family NADH-FMN oxidoreductase RutF
VPLLVGTLAAIDGEVEDIVERHCHAIVIGRVRDLQSSGRSSALANCHGRSIAIDQDEDIALFAEISAPIPRLRRKG